MIWVYEYIVSVCLALYYFPYVYLVSDCIFVQDFFLLHVCFLEVFFLFLLSDRLCILVSISYHVSILLVLSLVIYVSVSSILEVFIYRT